MTNGNDEKVVQMTKFRDGMKFPPITEVRAYWDALRGGRPVPCRSEVDPRGIETALEYAFVLERIAPGTARFRLAGSHLTDVLGCEVRGMPLITLFVSAARQRLSDTLEAVFAGPAIVEMSLLAETGLGRPAVEARLVILPLRSDLGEVSRALGCLVVEGSIGRSPRRFDLGSAQITAIEPLARPAARLPEPIGFSERPAPFLAENLWPPGRPHLRLVSSGD